MMAAKFNAELHWRDVYKKAETTGVEQVDGKDCYKVVLTPGEGSPITRYYDKQSNLLVKMLMTAKNPMGEIPVESMVSDYRKEGEILLAAQGHAEGGRPGIQHQHRQRASTTPRSRRTSSKCPPKFKALLKK